MIDPVIHSEIAVCSFCAQETTPPYIRWQSENEITICRSCASKYAHGLAIDLIALKSSHDLNLLTNRFLMVDIRTIESYTRSHRAELTNITDIIKGAAKKQ